MSELAFQLHKQKNIWYKIEDENGEKIKYKDNVIKVDFNKKVILGHIEYMRKRMKEEQANMQSDNIEIE